jgi:hypothetical protein
MPVVARAIENGGHIHRRDEMGRGPFRLFRNRCEEFLQGGRRRTEPQRKDDRKMVGATDAFDRLRCRNATDIEAFGGPSAGPGARDIGFAERRAIPSRTRIGMTIHDKTSLGHAQLRIAGDRDCGAGR